VRTVKVAVRNRIDEERQMAQKDKNTKKSNEKKAAQKTLKEKRQAKKAKK
jgi:hypothetical protein